MFFCFSLIGWFLQFCPLPPLKVWIVCTCIQIPVCWERCTEHLLCNLRGCQSEICGSVLCWFETYFLVVEISKSVHYWPRRTFIALFGPGLSRVFGRWRRFLGQCFPCSNVYKENPNTSWTSIIMNSSLWFSEVSPFGWWTIWSP